MSGTHITPGGILRKAVIVAFLVGAMIALHRFAIRGGGLDPTGMLAFGFVVLASYTFGQLVGVIKLPQIIGYIIAGFVLGPSMPELLPESWRIAPFDRGILDHEVQQQIGIIDALAVALISLSAGGELKLENLKKGFRTILALMSGHALAVFTAVLVFGIAISGVIPQIQIDSIAKLGLDGRLAMAALLASFAICTSPTVTLAVITETGAKGNFTTTVLSSVVLIDVPVAIIFSVVAAIAAQILGVSDSDSSLAAYLFRHVVLSLAAGFAIGLLIGLYLRYVGAEILIFLLGIAYAGTFFAKEMHMSPLLMFVAAGFACSNFSKAGDKLIHEVEALSLPVFVVFFTSTGAHLDHHIFLKAAPYALALAAVRLASSSTGVRAGARIANATSTVQKYAWMGFMSQAGVALSLAALIGQRYGEPGVALSTLMISCIAVNEVFGAIMFKTGLGLAKELPGDAHQQTPSAIARADGFHTWPEVQVVTQPFGPPLKTSTEAVDHKIEELEKGLVEVTNELREQTAGRFGQEADAHLKHLRREFLRHHRRVWIAPADTQAALSELAAVWRTALLEHAARLKNSSAISRLAYAHALEKIDDLIDALPARITAQYEDVSYQRAGGDSAGKRVRRSWLRMRRGFRRLFGSSPPSRRMALADLARFHLGGQAPAKLESAAATLFAGERHLAQRTARIFEEIFSEYSAKDRKLSDTRGKIEDSFEQARVELERIIKTASYKAVDAIGGALQAIKNEVPQMSTFDLPSRARRYTLVFRERARAIESLRHALPEAEKTIAMDFSLLGLNLELVRFEIQVSRAVEEHGSELARTVDGRAHKQLSRLLEHIDQALTKLDAELNEKRPGPMLATAIRQAAEPLARTAADAARAATELRDQLAGEKTITPVLETLLGATSALTERYELPAEPVQFSPTHLPPRVHTVEVSFRDAVITFIDTTVARELIELTRSLSEKVQPVAAALQEVERIVAFNAELAGAELDVFGDPDEIPEETRAMVREMVIGPLKRAKARVEQLLEASVHWGEEIQKSIRQGVLDELKALRALVVSGGASELRLRVIRDLAKGRAFLRGARDLASAVAALKTRASRAVVGLIGEARIPEARRALGLPEPANLIPDIRAALRSKSDPDRLPIVYRRLFTEHALQAGDLLTGREVELAHAYRVLAPKTGDRARARSLALVGRPGVGKSALTSAIVRSLGDVRVRRLTLTSPAREDEVAAWFNGAERGGVLTVLDGFEYLFTLKPQGFLPLERLIAGIVADREKNSWLISAASEVWSFAARAVPLEAAFPEVVHLATATVENLSSAVLARHTMSGYQLRFEQLDSIGPWLTRVLARRLDPEAWIRDEWFRTLHGITQGLIRDALRLWLESVRRVDDEAGIVMLGPIPRPPIATIAALPDSALLTLAQTMRQGWTAPELHGAAFGIDTVASVAELSRLAHWGLLERHGGTERWRIATHLESAVHRVLSKRRWLA